MWHALLSKFISWYGAINTDYQIQLLTLKYFFSFSIFFDIDDDLLQRPAQARYDVTTPIGDKRNQHWKRKHIVSNLSVLIIDAQVLQKMF